MVDQDKSFVEGRKTAVYEWIQKISVEGVVGEGATPEMLRDTLQGLGADFEPRPELEHLKRYSNLQKRPGLDAVWGSERVEQIKSWITEVYIPQYEQKTGRPLPTLEDSDIKHSGMMQFLGELTAYAAGQMDFDKYKRLTEDRARKGRVWQERDLSEPYVKSPHASFPPEFPVDMWEYLQKK